jgi:hypothetical protein
MEKIMNKTIKWNLTREQIIDEILYNVNSMDFEKLYNVNIFECSDELLVDIFNQFMIDNSNTVESQDIINKYSENKILIHTPDGLNEISDLYLKENLKCYILETANRKAKTSFNHQYEINEFNNWVFAKDIKYGDDVFTIDGWEEVTNVEHIGYSNVYDWTVEHENHRYWTASGLSSHNTGKSFLCYSIAKEAQKKGYGVIYIDTEYAIELDQLPGYGIDIDEDKFMLIRTNIIEDLKVTLTQILDGLKAEKAEGKEIHKFIMFIDSVGQLGSRKEVTDALKGAEKADFTKAKALSSLFRIINADLGFLGIPLVCTNHTYQCVTSETKVMMADGTFKEIKDITAGEFVETLVGSKEVNFIKKYDNAPVFKITMEDGTEIKCTSEHKFLVKPEWSEDENDSCWKNAIDLTENDLILSI